MSQRMLTIATFTNPVEATLAKNRLESAGIKAFLEGQETVAMAWHLTNAFGGIKLQVLEADSEDAIAILGENSDAELPHSGELEAELPSDIAEGPDESEHTTRE